MAKSSGADASNSEKPEGRFITDVFAVRGGSRRQIDLNGQWEFRRDADNIGVKKRWHEGKGEFPNSIKIPGAPQAQGIGEPSYRQKTEFSGPFWVRRTFRLPPLDPDQRVWLRIGGVMPAAEIYFNGTRLGYTKSSRTPERIDVTDIAKPGEQNLVAVKVCDLPEVRLDGVLHFDMLNWSGLWRPVACEITNRICITDAYVQPRLSTGAVRVEIELFEPTDEPISVALCVKDGKRTIGQASAALPAGKKIVKTEVKLKNFQTWSPEHPKLYTLDISLIKDAKPVDKVPVRFGMREISTRGTKFYLNGKPVFMRFFGEDHYYPETLCPPADKQWYLERLKCARRYGLNGVKACVDIVPPEYVEAADEAGIMIIQEMPFGLGPLRDNRYRIDDRFCEFYRSEHDGLVRASRNHASVVAFSMSSEMEFANQTQQSFDFFHVELPRRTKHLAPHALVIDCTGYLNVEATGKGNRVTDFYVSLYPKWLKEALDETPMITDRRHPMMVHEWHWWSSYPDARAKPKYDDTQIKPRWLDALTETATKNGQADLIGIYHKNSLRLQALCRKDGIEYARRASQVEGFILWLLIDFGPWANGMLDDFWQPKNVSAKEFSKSNADTVIVLAKEGNRCFRVGDKVRIPFAVSHYGEESYTGEKLKWKATTGRSVFAQGTLKLEKLPFGKLSRAGAAEFDLPKRKGAYKFELQVALEKGSKVINTNQWSFWAFPEVRRTLRKAKQNAGKIIEQGTLLRIGPAASCPIPEGTRLVVADDIDEALADYIEHGGKCLLNPCGAKIENTRLNLYKSFYKTFRTIPWNVGDNGNSGTVISPHPALKNFPHDEMCDLQFIKMIPGILPMEFEPLRQHGIAPIIRAIDHYKANRNNAYMLEFCLGKGKVLVTTLAVLANMPEHIEVRFFFECLLDYVRGESFRPKAIVPREEFLALFAKRPNWQTDVPGCTHLTDTIPH